MGSPSGRRVDSWKEIASYLKRGARTVQRWEREEGLPVHRLQHEKLGSVYAYAGELDTWWTSRGSTIVSDAPAAPATIAVLPFTDMSHEKDQEYFCDGMAEELINALSRLKGLRVASRISSFRFRGPAFDIREAGRALRAACLLEGSVRRSGERVRITVQLIDVENGYHLWSETYDRHLGDIFAIQEEIARRVANELEVTLTPQEHAALLKPPTEVLEAYDYYLRGREFYYQFSPEAMDRAASMFAKAVECDPGYPLAFAGLADCWSYRYLYVERKPAVLAKADAASRRAVEIDPDSAQSQTSRALALSLLGRAEEAEQAFESAIRLDPNLFEARYFYARHAFASGRPEQAVALYEEARRIRPDDHQSALLMAQIYEDLGRADDARQTRLRGIELAEQHLAAFPGDVRAIYMAANGMAALGQRESAREWAGRALAARPDDPMLLYNIGCIYSLLELESPALDVLERAVELGLTQKGWFQHDSNLDAVRAHPRFQNILLRLS